MSKKGENIYKRKDNRWEARYIKGYLLDGRARFGYCYGKTYREAKRKAEEAKAALINGKPNVTSGKKIKFDLCCDEWIFQNRDRVKESTFVKYSTLLEKYIKPRIGGCYISSLSSGLIADFSHTLLYEDELSAKSVKDILTLLRTILNFVSRNYTGALPNIEINYPKVQKNEMRVLTKEEQERFVKYLLHDMDEYKLGVLIALFTGMRIGEVCALQWKDVRMEEGIIYVRHTMQRIRDLDPQASVKTKIIISEPKSDTSVRVIPLADFLNKLISSVDCKNGSTFFLTGDEDRYVEPRNLQYHLERYTKECGLEGVHFHTLRHTFATRCVELDFEIKTLSEILGHSSPQITLERYVHSSLKLKRDNMNKLSAIGF